MPVAVLEGFVAFGLVIAAVAIARRSRLALVYIAAVQAFIVVEVVARIIVALASMFADHPPIEERIARLSVRDAAAGQHQGLSVTT